MHLLNLFLSVGKRGGRSLRLGAVLLGLLVVSLGLSACGSSYYFAGRTLPPSGILNRVLVAIQASGTGHLAIVDGLYDVRHNYNNTVPTIAVSGYNASSLPISIQNYPAERAGLVYSNTSGALSLVNYQTEAASVLMPAPAANEIASSVFASSNQNYVIAAQQQNHLLEMFDATAGTFMLNLPNVYRVSINPSGTIALAFLQNSNLVYSVVHLTQAQQQAAINKPTTFQINGNTSEDCEPQNLPQYCVFPVNTAAAAVDHPVKAVFSQDGSSAYIVNCGPECGGTTAGLTQIPLTASSLNTGAAGPAGASLATNRTIAVPGGATDAIFNGTTAYVAGQQLVTADGLFTGELSVVDTTTGSVSAPVAISDGDHERMVLADDNTLWIGSSSCQGGERYKQSQSGQAVPYGCVTMFNTSSNTVTTIESYKGDGTGLAAISGLHKMYTAEGGQLYIYNTTSGAALDNNNVTEQGIVVDVAYMDAPDDSDNTWY